VGWFKDIHLTEEWNFETDTVTGNMTLYAKWADAEQIIPGGDDEHKTGIVGEKQCIICGAERFCILSICWLCWLILILILLVLVLIIRKVIFRKKPKKKGKYEI